MTTVAATAATQMIDVIRHVPWGLGVVAVHDGETVIQIDEGSDSFLPSSSFEIGSVTKTMTGLLLAEAVLRGECGLSTKVGDVLGSAAGPASATTLVQLATQTSGLPRLPVGFKPGDPLDPYADLTEERLLASLADLPPLTSGSHLYSNLGFMLLALLLTKVAGCSYEDLLQERICVPAGLTMTSTVMPGDGALPGYSGMAQVPYWNGLPGSGRVVSTLEDMCRYLAFALGPSPAQALATEVHFDGSPTLGLGWMHEGGALWHNGGTGGFRTFVCAHKPTNSAVFLIANSGDASMLDGVGFKEMTRIIRGANS